MARATAAIDFKSATLTSLRLVLHSSNTAELIQALGERMAEAGSFYADEAVIIDALQLQQPPGWPELLDALRRHHLHPIGVQAQAEVLAAAQQAGMPELHPSTGRARQDGKDAADISDRTDVGRGAAAQAGDTSAPEPPAQEQTMVIRQPLRSGQRIYARNADLLVLGMVSQGAEVIADGHIHVYGPLRGKAMAGAHGRRDAMILTTQLEPELLAIAGVYRVVETRLPETLHKQAAQITLEGDSLRIRALHAGS